MNSKKLLITNQYSCSYSSLTNKICEWIIIFVIVGILAYFKYGNITSHKQCIPGKDSDCSKSISSPDPSLAYPELNSTLNFTTMNIICPAVWFLIFIINSSSIHYYNSLKSNTSYKILFIKMEILLRSAAISITFTSLTTDIIKIMVGRPRPNYLNNLDANDATKSFPSGHTSYIFSICFLFTLYSLHSLSNIRQLLNVFKIDPIVNSSGSTYDTDDTDDVTAPLTPVSSKEIKNQMFLQIDKIITVYNGDSYFFLSLFIWLRYCQIICVFICIAPTLFAVYVGCSRLIDYKHHYSDVLAGALIGIFYSFISFVYCKSEFYYGFHYEKGNIFSYSDNDNNTHNESDIEVTSQIEP